MAVYAREIADSIRQHIVSGLHLGTLGPGARLPSTRTRGGIRRRAAYCDERVPPAREGLLELRVRSAEQKDPPFSRERACLSKSKRLVKSKDIEAAHCCGITIDGGLSIVQLFHAGPLNTDSVIEQLGDLSFTSVEIYGR